MTKLQKAAEGEVVDIIAHFKYEIEGVDKYTWDQSATGSSFGDEHLPAIGHKMKNRMTLEAAQAAKVKAEEQANDQKRLAEFLREIKNQLEFLV